MWADIGLLPTDGPPRMLCEVRKLVGITPGQSKKRLNAAGCRVGKVKKPKRAHRKAFPLVVKRDPRPGAHPEKGTAISLTLKLVRVKAPRAPTH